MRPQAEARSSDAYDGWVAATNWLLMALSVLFVFVLVVPLVVHLTSTQRTACLLANMAIWVVFAVDYAARLYLVPDRRRFVRTHILDLLVVMVPFLRPLRLLRLFSMLGEFTRRSQESLAGRAMALVFTVAAVLMTTGAVVVYSFERNARGSNIKTFPDALWWAVSTVTTVGYGDVYPSTAGGRAIAVILMLTGIALVGTLTAAIASWFVGSTQRANREAAEEDAQLARDERSTLMAELTAVKASVNQLQAEIRLLRTHTGVPNGSPVGAETEL